MIPRLANSWYRQTLSPFKGVTTSYSKNVYKAMFPFITPPQQQSTSFFHTMSKAYQLAQQQHRSKIYSCMKLNQQLIAWPAGRRVYSSQIKNTNNKSLSSTTSSTNSATASTATKKAFSLETTTNESLKQRNKTDWAIIKQLMKYIWPKNDIGVKSRVVIALSLLIGGKVSKKIYPFI
ncbi:hypothetical protein BJ944DRAFT_95734 [Cunninghamella echinulata]|nr:hypothetical protein BJ944DRAFT_95734 [Cunninghamella echinulata]